MRSFKKGVKITKYIHIIQMEVTRITKLKKLRNKQNLNKTSRRFDIILVKPVLIIIMFDI